jgi:hypothetical protein
MPTATVPRRRVTYSDDSFEQQKMTRDVALQRYPRLIAHMICESLGYFSPLVAANALAHHINGTSFPCEWYSHICHRQGKGLFHDEALVEIGREVVQNSFQRRHRHKGPMAEYQQALALVMAERESAGATSGMLASWF